MPEDLPPTPSPNAPIVWILSGLACFCIGTLVLCCGWFFRVWEPEKTVSVRIYDTNIANPDLNSLVNLEVDENVDYQFWVINNDKPAQLGFLFRGEYRVVKFEQKPVVTKNELAAYYKLSQEGTQHIGISSPPLLTVNVTQAGEALSPFSKTAMNVRAKPANADFLRKVQ